MWTSSNAEPKENRARLYRNSRPPLSTKQRWNRRSVPFRQDRHGATRRTVPGIFRAIFPGWAWGLQLPTNLPFDQEYLARDLTFPHTPSATTRRAREGGCRQVALDQGCPARDLNGPTHVLGRNPPRTRKMPPCAGSLDNEEAAASARAVAHTVPAYADAYLPVMAPLSSIRITRSPPFASIHFPSRLKSSCFTYFRRNTDHVVREGVGGGRLNKESTFLRYLDPCISAKTSYTNSNWSVSYKP